MPAKNTAFAYVPDPLSFVASFIVLVALSAYPGVLFVGVLYHENSTSSNGTLPGHFSGCIVPFSLTKKDLLFSATDKHDKIDTVH